MSIPQNVLLRAIASWMADRWSESHPATKQRRINPALYLSRLVLGALDVKIKLNRLRTTISAAAPGVASTLMDAVSPVELSLILIYTNKA